MKRPGVSEKQAVDPDHEPDLYKISEIFPVPEKSDDESILLQCTLQGGPKARMPIYSASVVGSSQNTISTADGGANLTPSDQHALAAFQQSLGASENQLSKSNGAEAVPSQATIQPVVLPQSNLIPPVSFNLPYTNGTGMDKSSPLAIANQLAFTNPNMAAAFQASSAASQFAAGFAAATALSHQQFQAMLGQIGQTGSSTTESQQEEDDTPIPVHAMNNTSNGNIF